MQGQTVTEMAAIRAEFYAKHSPDELRDIMARWLREGLDNREITFWETRSERFRQLACQLAKVPAYYAVKPWADLSEDQREAIRVSLRELQAIATREYREWHAIGKQTLKNA